MYRTIILPLDGSPFAERAIPTAAAIAKRSAAALVLVRVHEAYAYEGTDHSRLLDLSRRDQEDYLALMAERVEEQHGLLAQRALLDGPIAPTISDFASGMEEPLIVLSTHGRTGFSRLWLGSIADAMMHHASVPILMLRHAERARNDGGHAHRFEKILVPLDGSDLSEAALPHAQSLAEAFRARLMILRVVAPIATPALYAVPTASPPLDEEMLNERVGAAEEYVREVKQHLAAENPVLPGETEVRVSDTPAKAILDVVKSRGADAVAIATHGRGLSRVVMASVADKVLRAGPDAVLVVRAEAGSE